jgi:pimeloyl-ACP methyl ester carboxylesterase
MLDIGGPVHVVDHGGDGPPMLLVHGLGGSLLDWMDVAAAFTSHHHVWSLDLLGFGRTPLGDRHASVDDNRRLVDAVARQVGDGEPVLLMGNSMGGLISILEAAANPELVSGLVLVDPALPTGSGGRLTLMVSAAFLVLAVPAIGGRVVGVHARWRGVERLVDDALKLCTVDVTRIRPETRAAHVELGVWRQQHEEDPHRAFVEATRSLVEWLMRRERLEPYIRAVTAPTLLIHGDSDRLVSIRAAGSLATMRPDWDFRVLTDTGHIPQMERPREFLTLVEHWLDDTRAARRGSQGDGLAVSAARR